MKFASLVLPVLRGSGMEGQSLGLCNRGIRKAYLATPINDFATGPNPGGLKQQAANHGPM
jgi:hypothetical protein